MKQYLIYLHGRVSKPLGFGDLKRMAASGEITENTQVSINGRTWTTAREVQGLFPVAETEARSAKQVTKVSEEEVQFQEEVIPSKSKQKPFAHPWLLAAVLLILFSKGTAWDIKRANIYEDMDRLTSFLYSLDPESYNETLRSNEASLDTHNNWLWHYFTIDKGGNMFVFALHNHWLLFGVIGAIVMAIREFFPSKEEEDDLDDDDE